MLPQVGPRDNATESAPSSRAPDIVVCSRRRLGAEAQDTTRGYVA
jgi:hypothetical protein